MTLTTSDPIIRFNSWICQYKKQFLHTRLYRIPSPKVTSDRAWWISKTKTARFSIKWTRSVTRFWISLSLPSHSDKAQRTTLPKFWQSSMSTQSRKPRIWHYKIKEISATCGIPIELLRNLKLSATLCLHSKKNRKKRFWLDSTNSNSNAIKSWSNCAWTRIWAKASTNSTSSETMKWIKLLALQHQSLC